MLYDVMETRDRLFAAGRIFLFVLAGTCLAAGLVAYCNGSAKLAESRAVLDSGRDGQFGEHAGRVNELVGAVGTGLGEVSGAIGAIKDELAGSSADLRSLAARLRNIAEVVEQMENDLLHIRGDFSELAGYIADSNNGAEINEEEENGPSEHE